MHPSEIKEKINNYILTKYDYIYNETINNMDPIYRALYFNSYVLSIVSLSIVNNFLKENKELDDILNINECTIVPYIKSVDNFNLIHKYVNNYDSDRSTAYTITFNINNKNNHINYSIFTLASLLIIGLYNYDGQYEYYIFMLDNNDKDKIPSVLSAHTTYEASNIRRQIFNIKDIKDDNNFDSMFDFLSTAANITVKDTLLGRLLKVKYEFNKLKRYCILYKSIVLLDKTKKAHLLTQLDEYKKQREILYCATKNVINNINIINNKDMFKFIDSAYTYLYINNAYNEYKEGENNDNT